MKIGRGGSKSNFGGGVPTNHHHVEMEEQQKMGNQGHIQSFLGDNIFSQKLVWHAKLKLDMPSENIN